MNNWDGYISFRLRPYMAALHVNASPRFDTIARECKALGVYLVVQAEHPF